MRAPCHLENQEPITPPASHLRPHQACPVAYRVSILFPCASLWTLTNQRSTPLPTSGRILLGVNDMDSKRVSVTWSGITQHEPNLTNQLSKFQTESTSQAPPVPGKRKKKKKDQNRPLRVPAGSPIKQRSSLFSLSSRRPFLALRILKCHEASSISLPLAASRCLHRVS